MASLQDLLFGLGDTPQAYSVPMPETEVMPMTGMLTGAPAALRGDSQVPGAMAAAAAQSQQAATQEPGMLDKAGGFLNSAKSWLQNNPMQAQALLQGFGALSSGRTSGNAIMQLGQAAGTGNQYMVEQAQANAAQAQEQQRYGQKTQADQANQERDNTRQDRVAASQIETAAVGRDSARETIRASAQRRDIIDKKFPKEMERMEADIATIRQQAATASTADEQRRLAIKAARLELDLQERFGPQMEEAKARKAVIEAGGAAERFTQEQQQTAAGVQTAADKSQFTPAERLGIKPPAGTKTRTEVALDLIKSSGEMYLRPGKTKNDPDTIDMDLALRHADQALGKSTATMPTPAITPEWSAARNSVQVGQEYRGPDGKIHIRRN